MTDWRDNIPTILARIKQSKLPVTRIDHANALGVRVVLDKQRTPRIPKLMRWLDSAGLALGSYGGSDGKGSEYTTNFYVNIPWDDR